MKCKLVSLPQTSGIRQTPERREHDVINSNPLGSQLAVRDRHIVIPVL